MKILVFLIFFISCTSTEKSKVFSSYQKSYKFTDISGEFNLWIESGKKSEREVFIKRKLVDIKDNKEFELSIAFSELGSLGFKNKRVNILRPKLSQYSVWFNQKKYFVQQEILPATKKLKITMRSPEKKWQGVKYYSFPSTRGAFCFFSQLVDCVKVTGFLKKSVLKKAGRMNLTIIWDGFPYVAEQYDGIYKTPFAKANLVYDGTSREKLHVFNLEFNNQVIFYHLDDNFELQKMFWVSQGLSQIAY